MKKMTLIFLLVILACSKLFAQNAVTIGQSRDYIKKMVQSNPNFKLSSGKNSDTLNFTQGMKAIFLYKDNVCYSSTSVLPLKYESALTEKMTTDSYKKVNDNTWVDSKETIKVVITEDKAKGVCFVTTTANDKK
jgi:hypothetical protein